MKRRKFLQWSLAASIPPFIKGCGNGTPDGTDKSGRRKLESIPGIFSIHEHIDSEKAAKMLIAAMDKTGIAKTNLLGCYESLMHGRRIADFDGAEQNNDLLMRVIKKYPDRLTAFVLLNGLEEDPVETLKGYLDQGALGVKMYNGTGNKYRNMPMTDPRLKPLFEYCDLHGIPVLIHVDPVNLDEYLDVVRDYPSIVWICPHLFVQTSPKTVFRLSQILRKFPNIYTDMSFGFEGWMHANLMQMSQSRDRIREIFIEHVDQMLFGTDVVCALNSPHRTVDWAANSFFEYRKFLEFESFHHRVVTGNRTFEGEVKGLYLPKDVLQKIYVENPKRIIERPKVATDGDDLNTVFHALPDEATLSDTGPYSLVTAAAVSALSKKDAPLSKLDDAGNAVATLGSLAEPIAQKLQIPVGDLALFNDAESLRKHVVDHDDVVGIFPLSDLSTGLKTLEVKGTDVTKPQISRCAQTRKADKASYFKDYPLLLSFAAPDTPSIETCRFVPHNIRTVILTGGSLLGKGMLETPAVTPKAAVDAISKETQAADVMHLSIENNVRDGCVQDLKRWRFCYSPNWLEALDHLGADVIELTGNHLPDYNDKILLQTLKNYRRHRYPYFGGGKNLSDALKPVVINIRGMKLGFCGINHLNPTKSVAANNKPGPLSSDHFQEVIEETAAQSDRFFFTYQGGYEFSPFPWNDMIRLSNLAVEAGAVGVIGTHAHMPMGVEVNQNSLVAYGLGNFLFRHPGSAIPNRKESAQAIVIRHTLYGDKLIQADVIPVVQDNGALSFAKGKIREQIRNRVREASNPGLGPRIPMPTYADANVELDTNKGVHGIFDVQRKLGLSGIIFSMTEKQAQETQSPAALLKILSEVANEKNYMAAGGIKIAFPLLPDRQLPEDDFDAVRIFASDDSKSMTESIRIAAGAGKPIQLKCKNDNILGVLPSLLSISGKISVILSGLSLFTDSLPTLSATMASHPQLYVDMSASRETDFTRYFSLLEEEPELLSQFFKKYSERILLATGTSSEIKRLSWTAQPRLLRALHESLLYDTFRLPDIRLGNKGEWGGYRYIDEPKKIGLGLDAKTVIAIAGGNFHRLFPDS